MVVRLDVIVGSSFGWNLLEPTGEDELRYLPIR